MTDPFDLARFVTAQDPVLDRVLAELRSGRKRSHWMWFVFPQLRGLGRTSTADYYGLSSLAEARAYVAHPLLGPRLVECARALLSTTGHTAEQVLGTVDAMKLRSSMTLFAAAAPETPEFAAVLDAYFAGRADPLTLGMLGLPGLPGSAQPGRLPPES